MGTFPERIGKYTVERKLGSGGFAIVYKAKDPSLNRDVAIKVLHTTMAEESEAVQRFYREAQIAANLKHPHIVTIYEIGHLDDGRAYLVMEYLPGLSLAEFLRQNEAIPLDQALSILEQVGQALDYAHSRNLIHRDVKPQNIMIEQKQDGSFYCVLTDFGLVKVAESGGALTSRPLGTPEYMAPEQIVADLHKKVGPATDVYALGVLAYRILTGRVPFEGEYTAVLFSQVRDRPPDPRDICDSMAPEIAAVLLKALSKAPEDRYASAGEMVAALRLAVEATSSLQMPFELDTLPWEKDRQGHTEPAELPSMICIPAGSFLMGSDESDPRSAANERPRHTKFLGEYHIGRYPVTNAQYQAFVQATGHPAPPHWPDGQVPPDKVNHPVVNISHQDASDYGHWLSKIVGQHCRLPTEYEWEKAARGGEPEIRCYPWGDRWEKGFCNSLEEGLGDTTAVDRYEAHNRSPYGVVDMAGNVWEWTDSLYRPYPGSSHQSISHGSHYIVRGGSWKNGQEDARISARGRYPPDVRRPYLGFRVVWETE